MLHIDVSVPALGRSYEFQVNEQVKIGALADEISAVVSTKEQMKWKDDTAGLVLCNTANGNVLPNEKTLLECAVGNGSRLILV